MNPTKELKTIKVDPEIHRQIKTEASALAEEIGTYVEEMWKRHRDGTAGACPACGAEFRCTESSIELIHAGGSVETVAVSADLRDTVEAFLRFIASPDKGDKVWRDTILQVLGEKYGH